MRWWRPSAVGHQATTSFLQIDSFFLSLFFIDSNLYLLLDPFGGSPGKNELANGGERKPWKWSRHYRLVNREYASGIFDQYPTIWMNFRYKREFDDEAPDKSEKVLLSPCCSFYIHWSYYQLIAKARLAILRLKRPFHMQFYETSLPLHYVKPHTRFRAKTRHELMHGPTVNPTRQLNGEYPQLNSEIALPLDEWSPWEDS